MALHYTPGDVQVLAVNAERIIRRTSSHYKRNSSEGGSEDSDYQSSVFSSVLSIHPRHQTLIRAKKHKSLPDYLDNIQPCCPPAKGMLSSCHQPSSPSRSSSRSSDSQASLSLEELWEQEQCLSHRQGEGEEDRVVTSIESFGEDYAKVLRIRAKDSSDESFSNFDRIGKRRIRLGRCKVVSCKYDLDTSECIAGTEDEEDIKTKIKTHDKKLPMKMFKLIDKVKSLAEKLNGLSGKLDENLSEDLKLSSQHIKTLGSKLCRQPKASTNLRPKPSHLHLLCSLLVFSILSVSWLCHPQCCEYYQAWQVLQYRGGTLPT